MDTKNNAPAVGGLTEKHIENVCAAMKRAYNLGQTYWQQADSEYTSQHKKADATEQKFIDLNDEICGVLRELLSRRAAADTSGLTRYVDKGLDGLFRANDEFDPARTYYVKLSDVQALLYTSAVRGVGLTEDHPIVGLLLRTIGYLVIHDEPKARSIGLEVREVLSTANAAQAGVREESADTSRINFLRENPAWSLRWRIKNQRGQWQMLDDGEPWGQWGEFRQVIDAARRALKSTPSPSVNSKEGGNG